MKIFDRIFRRRTALNSRGLTDFEEEVLFVIDALGPDAYGVPVRHKLEIRLEREVNYGELYRAINGLEEKGFIRSELREATKIRGWFPKRMCTVIRLPD